MSTQWALRMRSKEVKGSSGSIMTPAEAWAWVTDGEWGPSTYRGALEDCEPLLFPDAKAAADFAAKWDGHPWYFQPDRVHEIHKMEPRMVQDGWVSVEVQP